MKRWALNRYVGYSAVLMLVTMTSGCMTGNAGMHPLDSLLGGCVGPACDGGSCSTGSCSDSGCAGGGYAGAAGCGSRWSPSHIGKGLFSATGRLFRGASHGDRGDMHGGSVSAGATCGDGYCAGKCGGRCAAARARHQERMAAFSQHLHNACANGGCQRPTGPTQGAVTYPYYTTRGPRDFLEPNPPSIGP